MNILKKVLYAALGLLTGIDLLLLLYVFFINHHVGAASTVYLRGPDTALQAAGPVGYSSAGVRLLSVPGANIGWVVRYGSPKCEFCRADETRWKALKAQLMAKGYHLYDLFPNAQDVYPDAPTEQVSETQISFVDVAWMKHYRLTGTPTTLLFDSRGKLIWANTGVMSEGDQQLALQAAAESK